MGRFRLTETHIAILKIMLDNHNNNDKDMTREDVIDEVIRLSEYNPKLKAELNKTEINDII